MHEYDRPETQDTGMSFPCDRMPRDSMETTVKSNTRYENDHTDTNQRTYRRAPQATHATKSCTTTTDRKDRIQALQARAIECRGTCRKLQ